MDEQRDLVPSGPSFEDAPFDEGATSDARLYLLRPMSALYKAPVPDHEEDRYREMLRNYEIALAEFPPPVLEVALDNLRMTWKRVRWPLPAELVAICLAAREHLAWVGRRKPVQLPPPEEEREVTPEERAAFFRGWREITRQKAVGVWDEPRIYAAYRGEPLPVGDPEPSFDAPGERPPAPEMEPGL